MKQATTDRKAMENKENTQPKFTPGPWEVFTGDGTTNWHTLVIRRREPQNGIEQLPVDICACHNCLCDASEKPANAALIAAAPEMYALLNNILNDLETDGSISLNDNAANDIRGLLAKVRGEAAE